MSWPRVLGGIGWTVLLAAVLFGADRLLLGEVPGTGWMETGRIEEAETMVGPLVVPRYLPDTAGWPPSRLLVRRDARGWWMGLAPAGRPVGLWIGIGDQPLPSALAAYEGCVWPAAAIACPRGWSALSAPLPDGSTVFLVSTLEPAELARVAEGLVPSR